MRSLPTAPATGLASILPDHPAGSLTLAAAVAATAAAPHPDATLLDLGRRWLIMQHEWEEAPVESDAEGYERSDREHAIIDVMVRQPATTFLGLAVKARVMAREADCEAPECFTDAGITAWATRQLPERVWLERVVASLCLDLLRLAGEAGR